MSSMDTYDTWSVVRLNNSINWITNPSKMLEHSTHFKDRGAILNFLCMHLTEYTNNHNNSNHFFAF